MSFRVVIVLALVVLAPSGFAADEPSRLTGGAISIDACIAELTRGVERGAQIATPNRPPESFSRLFAMGSAAWSLKPEQSLSNAQQRWLELDRAFGPLGASGLIAIAVAEELEATGRKSKKDFQAVAKDFLGEYPTTTAQIAFLDAVAQRILHRVKYDRSGRILPLVGAPRPLTPSALTKLHEALVDSASSGFAELELFVLHHVVSASDEYQRDLLGARRGWFRRLMRSVFRRRLPATLPLSLLVGDDPEVVESDANLRTFLGELRGATGSARNFFVVRNLYLLPADYLDELMSLPLSETTLALVEGRRREIEEEAAAAEEIRTLGILRDEVRQVFADRRDFRKYLAVRRTFATHAEAIAVLELAVTGKLDVVTYVTLRHDGCDHTAAIDYRHVKGTTSISTYVAVLRTGATPGEIAAALEAGVPLDAYRHGRTAHVPHDTILHAWGHGALDDLHETIEAGATGAEVSTAYETSRTGGWRFASYRKLRATPLSHGDALSLLAAGAEAHSSGVAGALKAQVPVAEVRRALEATHPAAVLALRGQGVGIEDAVHQIDGVGPLTAAEATALATLLAANVSTPEAKDVLAKLKSNPGIVAAYLAGRRANAPHAQALATAQANVDADDYAALLGVGATPDEAVEALSDDSVSFEAYRELRKAGYVHAEAKEAAALAQEYGGKKTRETYHALRVAGVPHAAAINEYKAVEDPDKYLTLVQGGASSSEAVEALAASNNVKLYLELRKGGASHAEAMEAVIFEVQYVFSADTYFAIRKKGVSHKDTMAAYTDAKDIDDYVKWLEFTSSHDDAFAVAKREDLDHDVYENMRKGGYGQTEAVEAAKYASQYTFDFDTYKAIRDLGVSHTNAMAAYKDAQDIDNYLAVLQDVKTHEDAMAVAERDDLDMDVYKAVRKHGYDSKEATDAAKFANDSTFSADKYHAIRQANVSHDDSMKAYKELEDIDDYLKFLGTGAPHSVAFALEQEALDTDVYLKLVGKNVPHVEALTVAKAANDYTIDIDEYMEVVHGTPKRVTTDQYVSALSDDSYDWDDWMKALKQGRSHDEAVEVATAVKDNEVDVDDYVAILALGRNHAEALRGAKAITANTLSLDDYRKLVRAELTPELLEEVLVAKEGDDDVDLVRFATAYRQTKNVDFAKRMAGITKSDDED